MDAATPAIPAAPAVRDEDRKLVAPWFETSGLSESSPEWARAWSALVAAGLAGDHGLNLWPADGATTAGEEPLPPQAVTLALATGARYARSNGHAEERIQTGRVLVDAGTGVEVALAVLRTERPVLLATLNAPAHERVQRLLTELRTRVLGVFAGAPAALSACIAAARTATVHQIGAAALADGPWPALVELVLREAVTDDVFAEHICLKADLVVSGVGCVVLPSGAWLITHAA